MALAMSGGSKSHSSINYMNKMQAAGFEGFLGKCIKKHLIQMMDNHGHRLLSLGFTATNTYHHPPPITFYSLL